MSKWYGVCDNVEYISHGQSDGELRYRGISFTEWMIADAMWSEFLESNDEFTDNDAWTEPAESKFKEYLADRIDDYLEDVIYSMAPTFFEMMPWDNRIMKEVVEKGILELDVLEYLAEKERKDVLSAIYEYANNPFSYNLQVFGSWDSWIDYREWYELEEEDYEVFDDTGLDMTIVVLK